MVCAKFRIRFRKGGQLRLVSHHDLMRCYARMLRRADLPVRRTGGFHPMPRVVFPLSLPLGVVGLDEAVEIELTSESPADEVLSRLRRQAPDGLDLLSIRPIAPQTTGQVRRAVYRLAVPTDRLPTAATRCADLMAASECWVERSRPQPRRLNVRP